MFRKILKYTVILLAAAAVLIVASGVYFRSQLRASLPQVTGSAAVQGLTARVRVDRDALGVPTITGGTREDVARALGFLHAQDRFFQMDLQRRQPAGELSGLVGARAMEVDEDMRVHRFRSVAHRALELAEPSYRKILDAYADGVNAGLNALGAPPFEYLVLRAAPEPWRPEDSILTVLAMFNTLQGRQAVFEQSHGALRDTLPSRCFDSYRRRDPNGTHRSSAIRFSGHRSPTLTCLIFENLTRKHGITATKKNFFLNAIRKKTGSVLLCFRVSVKRFWKP